MIADLIVRMEAARNAFVDDAGCEAETGAALIAIFCEALGVLRTLDDYDLTPFANGKLLSARDGDFPESTTAWATLNESQKHRSRRNENGINP